jgi:hypothetical protein
MIGQFPNDPDFGVPFTDHARIAHSETGQMAFEYLWTWPICSPHPRTELPGCAARFVAERSTSIEMRSTQVFFTVPAVKLEEGETLGWESCPLPSTRVAVAG